MKTALSLVLSLIIFIACNNIITPMHQHNLKIIHLTGNPYERGFTHGEIMEK